MKRHGLILMMLLTVPLLASAQSVCNICHGSHGAGGSGSNDFHSGGVGNCRMCHTMHNSQDGTLVDPSSPGGNAYLLNAATATDVCLACHGGTYGNVFGDNPLMPPREVGAGNFVFLLEDNVNDGHNGAANPIPGCATGHSIVAPSRGMAADPIHDVAPGGNYPADQLGCTSCHDPHGNDNYRMLHDAGPVQDGLYDFLHDAPDAEGLSIYHGGERESRHSAYRSGMSEWCGNCHGEFHAPGTNHAHVTGELLGKAVVRAYNRYNGTSDPQGAVNSESYLPQVPFEDPRAGIYSTEGASSRSRVMCLTCHRAHATSAPDALRWDPNVTFLSQDGEESGSYVLVDPYNDRVQRSLCNKCHPKDEFDRLARP